MIFNILVKETYQTFGLENRESTRLGEVIERMVDIGKHELSRNLNRMEVYQQLLDLDCG